MIVAVYKSKWEYYITDVYNWFITILFYTPAHCRSYLGSGLVIRLRPARYRTSHIIIWYCNTVVHSFYVTDASRKLAENRRAEVRFEMVMTHECYSTIIHNIWVGTIGIRQQQQYYTYGDAVWEACNNIAASVWDSLMV